jgi:ABC-type spermidine/putrescine transport system permease subunit I
MLPYIYLAPSLALIVVLFAYPFLRLVALSLTGGGSGLRYYVALVHDPGLWKITANTVILAAACTLVVLLLAYPVAYLLSMLSRRYAALLMIFVLFPLWTSILVRMYAWMVLLGRHGLINESLMRMGLINQPLPLLYNKTAVIVGMTHYLLPFMILVLYGTMIGIDRGLLEASHTLGSTLFQTFVRIYFPLSLPGVYAGCLLVFILGLGFYVTPALLGSPRETTVAIYIQQQAANLEFGSATAMAFMLLILAVVLFAVYDRLMGFERLFGRLRT